MCRFANVFCQFFGEKVVAFDSNFGHLHKQKRMRVKLVFKKNANCLPKGWPKSPNQLL
jgi:hypothetical protein